MNNCISYCMFVVCCLCCFFYETERVWLMFFDVNLYFDLPYCFTVHSRKYVNNEKIPIDNPCVRENITLKVHYWILRSLVYIIIKIRIMINAFMISFRYYEYTWVKLDLSYRWMSFNNIYNISLGYYYKMVLTVNVSFILLLAEYPANRL